MLRSLSSKFDGALGGVLCADCAASVLAFFADDPPGAFALVAADTGSDVAADDPAGASLFGVAGDVAHARNFRLSLEPVPVAEDA